MEMFKVGLDLDWVVFWLYFFPLPGVKKFLKKLQGENCEIVIITSRTGFLLTLGKWCLRVWGLGNIPIFGAEERNGGKAPLLKELKVKVFIDNTLRKVKSIVNVVPYPVWFYWFVGNHNSLIKIKPGDWEKILEFIKTKKATYC